MPVEDLTRPDLSRNITTLYVFVTLTNSIPD